MIIYENGANRPRNNHRVRRKELRGIVWNDMRGYTSLVGTAQRFEELNPGVSINWDRLHRPGVGDKSDFSPLEKYDLIAVDTSTIGLLAAGGNLSALDNIETQAIGPSTRQFSIDGRQWALPIDIVAHMSVFRRDLIDSLNQDLPETWFDLINFSKNSPVAIPGSPQSLLSIFYMLCFTLSNDPFHSNDLFVEESVGITAIDMLSELSQTIDPRSYQWNTIDIYEKLSKTDDLIYCPFIHGYPKYAKPGFSHRALAFGDLVELPDNGRLKSTVSGTGIALSAKSTHQTQAEEYISFVGDPQIQKGVVFDAGGHPGHRDVLSDKRLNRETGGFFAKSRHVLDRAIFKPEDRGHAGIQEQAGLLIRENLISGDSRKQLIQFLNRLYRTSWKTMNVNTFA